MKKLLAVVMALVMVFAFCVPSFAATTTGAAEGGLPDMSAIMGTISNVVSGILGSLGTSGSGSNMDIGSIIEGIGDLIGNIGGGSADTTSTTGGETQLVDISAEDAKRIVDVMMRSGATKADVQTAVDQMYADGQLSEVSYINFCAAIAAAEEVTTTPVVDDAQASEAATKIIDALLKMGIPKDQIKSTVDELYENEAIPQNVYDEIIKQLDAAEATTAASNEGGIGGFLGGIVDKITGLFGGGSGDGAGEGGEGGDGNGNGTTTNPDSYEGKEPTGDTAILSVAAVAAVAGVALVLTKKKQK